jgi:hypothetical protein
MRAHEEKRAVRGRCQRCTFAGEVVPVTYALPAGDRPVTRRLCEHCAFHGDTPAMDCARCMRGKESLQELKL